MSKTIEQIELELDSKIPRDAVCERDGGGGRRLSYLEGHYVIDRLNKVFGPLNWSKEILDVRQIVNTTARGEFPAYLVKVALSIHAPDDSSGFKRTVKEAYGYGADKSSQNAHELAIKEAVTDALKVAAKDLGMSLGLALYSKEQENVDDGQPEAKKPAISQRPKSVERAEEAPKGIEKPSPADKPSDLGNLRTLIRSYVNAAIKKGVLTMPDMKEKLQADFKSDSLDPLTKDQLEKVLEHVKSLTN